MSHVTYVCVCSAYPVQVAQLPDLQLYGRSKPCSSAHQHVKMSVLHGARPSIGYCPQVSMQAFTCSIQQVSVLITLHLLCAAIRPWSADHKSERDICADVDLEASPE